MMGPMQGQDLMRLCHGGKLSKFFFIILRVEAKSIKLYSDATLVFPLIVAETFAKNKEVASRLDQLVN